MLRVNISPHVLRVELSQYSSRGDFHAFRVEIWQCSARGDRVNRDVMDDVTPDALSCVLTPPVDTGS